MHLLNSLLFIYDVNVQVKMNMSIENFIFFILNEVNRILFGSNNALNNFNQFLHIPTCAFLVVCFRKIGYLYIHKFKWDN